MAWCSVTPTRVLLGCQFIEFCLPNQGDLLVRNDLADLFETIAANGSRVLYSGPIAEGIVDTVANNTFMPGILTLQVK